MAWRRNKEALDFGHTCPVIDGNISKIEDAVWENLPAKDDLDGYDESDIYNAIMEAIKPHLEDVRKTNIDMRAAADAKIAEFSDELDDLRSELKDKDSEIRDLRNDVSRLESEVKNLEYELS